MSPAVLDEVGECYRFLEEFSKDKIIYGINTGFGPMAQWRGGGDRVEGIPYKIIRSPSKGARAPL